MVRSNIFLIEELVDFYNEQIDGENISGPLVDRKVFKLKMNELFALKFDGLEIIHCEALHFKNECYLLANDIVNECENVVDAFYFLSDQKEFINYVENSQIKFKVDAKKGALVLVKRNKENIYIRNDDNDVKFIYSIYK